MTDSSLIESRKQRILAVTREHRISRAEAALIVGIHEGDLDGDLLALMPLSPAQRARMGIG